ncbi:Paf1-domain-containing protein [Tribonema minus]|uniref:Paf1-domain-containing protein n=1 Tax=Tribonema minus TaxID=303371 RepID=A0A835YRH5_9STRA|nr:Paf1-domain-containing protein [Tribonema minus]
MATLQPMETDMASQLQPPPPPPLPVPPAATSQQAAASAGAGADGVPPDSSRHREESSKEKEDRRRKDKERVQKERAEKEKIRKEHARKVLEQQKIQTARRKWQKDSEFLCHLKFRNNLPDPPLGPHFLKIPLSMDKLVQYTPTTLETQHKWKLHCNRDLGVDIDIIDSRSYSVPDKPPTLHPKDAELLQWDKVERGNGAAEAEEGFSRRMQRKQVDTSVTWLKKTVYLTNDPFDAVHKFRSDRQVQMDAKERMQKDMEESRKTDRVSAVLQSFAEANSKKKLVHATNKSLTPEWVMPVLPDAALWGNTYTHVVFDIDPIEEEHLIAGPRQRKRQRADKAIVGNVRKLRKSDGDEFVTGSYMVPKEAGEGGGGGSAEGGEKGAEGGTGFAWVKDYQMNVQNYPAGQGDSGSGSSGAMAHLVFIIDQASSKATFCQLSARVDLANLPAEDQANRGPGMEVARRPPSDEEFQAMGEKVAKDLGVLAAKHMRRAAADAAAVSSRGAGEGVRGGRGYGHGGADGARGGGGGDGDGDSVMTEHLESEGSNVAVKGTDTSEGDEMSRVGMDDSDEDGLN